MASRMHPLHCNFVGLSERTWHSNYAEICTKLFCCPPIVGHPLPFPRNTGVWHRTLMPGLKYTGHGDMEHGPAAELSWGILFKTDSTSKSNTMHFNSFLPLSCRQFFFVQSSQSCWVIMVPHGLWHNCTIVWLKRTSSGSQPIFPAYRAESFISGPGWGSSRGHRMLIMVNITQTCSILPDPSSRQRLGRMS